MRQGEARCGETHTRASRSLSRWYRSICLANTIPAGHVWPPHPEVRSSWTFNGVESRPPKSNAVSLACLYSGRGAKSMPMVEGSSSGEDERDSFIVEGRAMPGARCKGRGLKVGD